MKERLFAEYIDAVEWYDGIVSGFVHGKDGIFLCFLLALEPNSGRRRYALLRVERTAGPSPTLDQFANFVESIFASSDSSTAELYLTNDEPKPEAVVGIEKATPRQVSKAFEVRIPCIDHAVLPSAQRAWLS